MTQQLPFDYYLNRLNKNIVLKFRHSFFEKIKNRVVRNLQKNTPGVLPDGILKNMWDEICVIIQEGDDEFYDACIDTIDGEIELIIEAMVIAEWQLCALWLGTSNGLDWALDEKDKNPKEQLPFVYNINDIRDEIRKEYILDAAMNWSNARIQKFHESSYEMDNEFY